MTRDLLALAGLLMITAASFMSALWFGLLVAGVLLVALAVLLSLTREDVEEVQQTAPEPEGKLFSGVHVPDDEPEGDSTLERLIKRDGPVRFKNPISSWRETSSTD